MRHILGIILAATATLTIAACNTTSALQDAKADCASTSPHIRVGDDGRSMTINGEGEESTGAGIAEVACILYALEVSDAVVSRIDSTRALDGTLTGEWGRYAASWTYHPNSGLNVVIEVAR